jgi:hypothetical protein
MEPELAVRTYVQSSLKLQLVEMFQYKFQSNTLHVQWTRRVWRVSDKADACDKEIEAPHGAALKIHWCALLPTPEAIQEH